MFDHDSSVFTNRCVKVPINPSSFQPNPIYEQKYLNNLQNQRNFLDKKDTPVNESNILKSLIEFYDSIPEYDDINHLSNEDFYRKLQRLKDKQQSLYDYMKREYQYSNKNKNWVDNYKNLNMNTISKNNNKMNFKSQCKIQNNKSNSTEDLESIVSSDQDTFKSPFKRSVKIESSNDFSNVGFRSLKKRHKMSLLASNIKRNKNNINLDYASDDLSTKDFRCNSVKDHNLKIRSAPSTPSKQRNEIKENNITIPKPFNMTIRDEEDKILDDVMLNFEKPKSNTKDLFKANPVPIESKILLFDKIMAEQERRSKISKHRRKETLKSEMKPFSFTRREEQYQSLSNCMSKSSPSILQLESTLMENNQFKAKPVPKGLFSNYIYHKMHEDEFYRALQRKIRSEELLKSSSLPPSMAKREKLKPKLDVCPKSLNTFNDEFIDNYKIKSASNKFKDSYDKELGDLSYEFINETKSPRRTGHKNRRKEYEKHLKRCYGTSSTSSSGRNVEVYRPTSAANLLSVNKSNLAAVLRIQNAKKRMQMEMCRKLEEAKLKEEARWREKVLRKRPAWQKLAYSHEEDLAMRLQLRREEERLRNEEHRHRMELMYGRVNRIPMLFERQSNYQKFLINKKEECGSIHFGENSSTLLTESDANDDELLEKLSHIDLH